MIEALVVSALHTSGIATEGIVDGLYCFVGVIVVLYLHMGSRKTYS